MSKPRYRWWGFARAMVRDYPKLEKELEEIHRQSMSASFSDAPSKTSAGRITESVALRQLPADDQKVYDAVTMAKKITSHHMDGEEHLLLISYMYWRKKTLTAKQASVLLHISYDTAKRWHGSFIRLVGMCYGFSI